MFKHSWYLVLGILLLLPAASFGYGHYTVYSTVPADVYVDNQYRATIGATQTLKLILPGPQSYVIGVRSRETGEAYKEAVNVGTNQNEHRDIRAFSNIQPYGETPTFSNLQTSTAEITVSSLVPANVYIDNVLKTSIEANQPVTIDLAGPRSYLFEVRSKGSNMLYREVVEIPANANIKKEIRAFSNSAMDPQTTNGEITVYSLIPADIYIDGIRKTSLDVTHPMVIDLPGPRTYDFELRSKESNMIFREEVVVPSNANIKKDIRAFSETLPPTSTTEAIAQGAETPAGGISREEMASAIQKATAQAKAEALAEEAARRKREDQRALSSKGIAHVVGVEANKNLPGSVKNMERIKLLLEVLPGLKK
jgi:hypothetical protein